MDRFVGGGKAAEKKGRALRCSGGEYGRLLAQVIFFLKKKISFFFSAGRGAGLGWV